jgi:hypothetical protein
MIKKISTIWKRIISLLRGVTQNKNKKEFNMVAGTLADEAPLYDDGFSNHMRSLQVPFFN